MTKAEIRMTKRRRGETRRAVDLGPWTRVRDLRSQASSPRARQAARPAGSTDREVWRPGGLKPAVEACSPNSPRFFCAPDRFPDK